MIVRRADGGLVLYAQEDHAHVSGECAAMLADAPGPAAALVAAARAHDNGWREADEAPTLNPSTGAPYSFEDVPHAPYRDIWRRGIDRAVALDPYVGLLVMLHGGRFFRRSEDPRHRAFYEEVRSEGDALLRALGLEGSFERAPAEVERQFEWVRFLDAVSLVVCGAPDWARHPRVGGIQYELRPMPGVVRVAPWPFRAPFEVRIPARRLGQERFASQRELMDAYQRAPVAVEPTRIEPA